MDGTGILGAMWRHRLLMIAVLVVAVGAGLGFTMLQSETYTASARVFMSDPREEGVFRTDPVGDDTRRQQNRVERFRSEDVLVRAAEIADTSMTLSELRDVVEVSPAAVADEITVSARTPDPVMSRDLANAVVAAYRQQFSADALADAERTVEVLDQELATLQAQLEEVEAELAPYATAVAEGEELVSPEDESLPASHVTMLRVRRDAHVSMIRDLLVTRRQTMIDARAAEDVAVVEEAETPLAPSQDPVFAVSLSVALGLAAGALLSVWREERLQSRSREAALQELVARRATRRPVTAPPQPPRT